MHFYIQTYSNKVFSIHYCFMNEIGSTSAIFKRDETVMLRDEVFVLWLENSLIYCVVPTRISTQSSRHCWRSPLPLASAFIQRDFGCVLGVQQTMQLPHAAKVDRLWQLGV
ncbi:hypothetical protein TNCV_2113641 [Trichonephila clavipes]|nr:hypothetical protein TNCV_2113641 [Trichonephila clavipes]